MLVKIILSFVVISLFYEGVDGTARINKGR